MNKRGFLIRDFVIASILLMGIVALMILMIQGLAINYDSSDLIDENFASKYDKLQNVTDSTSTLWETTNSDEGLSFLGTLDLIFKATFTALSLVFSTFTLMQSVFSNFAADFGIPIAISNIVFTVGFSAITIVIIYTWFSSVNSGRI